MKVPIGFLAGLLLVLVALASPGWADEPAAGNAGDEYVDITTLAFDGPDAALAQVAAAPQPARK